jgi:hypothetical protein
MHDGNMKNIVVNWRLVSTDHRYLGLTFRSTLLSWASEPVACRSISSVFGLFAEVYNVCVNETIVPVILKFSPCNIETFC